MIAGSVVSVLALLATQVALPLADRWSAREATLAARQDEASRLRGIVDGEPMLRAALSAQRASAQGTNVLLLAGSTPALAASGLQVLLRRYAEESQVQLDRVDVAGQPKADQPGLLAIPVVMQGQGDIYGLVDLLFRLQHGERLVVTDEVAVNAGFDRAGFDPTETEQRQGKPKLLNWTVRAHALYPLAGRPGAAPPTGKSASPMPPPPPDHGAEGML